MEFMVEMLATNGGCELPCWWGITPGEASYRAVREFFSLQGVPLSFPRAWGFEVPHPERLFDYVIDAEFGTEDGIVSSIIVDGFIFSGQTSQRFASDWRHYAWDQILTQYGPPSRVLFSIAPPMERDAPVGYSLALLYESLGVAIFYGGPAQYDVNTSRACPNFDEVETIRLILVSARHSVVNVILELSASSTLGPSLEEMTGMSKEVFYETFKSAADGSVCLESSPAP
jgi:hypothetical protein